uniref:Uncharacterized protein n=1 Tax=Avena sativa TaxID=4498 RepID=A0ACD5VIJ4_AVESA
MSSSSGYVAIPRCPVIFDDANYPDFAAFMRVHMRGLRLWGVLSGEVSCPPRPVVPPVPLAPTPVVLAPDATQAVKDAAQSADDSARADYERRVQAHSTATTTYRLDLAEYTQWIDEDAHAFLRQRYQPSGDALYLSVVRQEHELKQGDSTIDDFYTQSAAIWRQLDSLRTAVCNTCPCCLIVRADLEFQRVFEFLSRLRKEFEPRRAQLLARGRVPLSEVLAELHAEENRLRGAGLLEVPSVLAARGPPVPPASSRSLAPPLLSAPPAQGQSHSQQPRGSRPPCAHCGKPGHDISGCWTRDPRLRQQYLARRQSGSSGSSAVASGPPTGASGPHAGALSDQDIIRGLRSLLAATGSSSSGTAGSVPSSSGTARSSSSTQSGPSYTGSGWSWPSQH